jgi:hypothetical protein
MEKNLNMKRGEMRLFSFFYTSLQIHYSSASEMIENEYGVISVSLYPCLILRYELARVIRLKNGAFAGCNC